MKLQLIFVFLGMCLFHGVSTTSDNENPVKLTLFYESYCPFSIGFFVNQLYKVWKELKDHIKLELVPFGLATQKYKDGHVVFTCHHGPKECVGNILHACAIYQACSGHGTLQCLSGQLAKAMDYINCVMRYKNQQAASDQCASQSGLDLNSINQCAGGVAGEQLESFYGNHTEDFVSPKVDYVPFIVFNNKHNEEEHDPANEDLKSVICRYIPNRCRDQARRDSSPRRYKICKKIVT